jgi:hypothetical protein
MHDVHKGTLHCPVFRDDFPDIRAAALYFPDGHRRTPQLA